MEDFESKKYLPGNLREAHYGTFRGWTTRGQERGIFANSIRAANEISYRSASCSCLKPSAHMPFGQLSYNMITIGCPLPTHAMQHPRTSQLTFSIAPVAPFRLDY